MPPYAPPEPEGEGGRRDLIVAVAVILVAFATTFLGDSTQEAIASRVRGTALLPFVSLQQGLGTARMRAVRNEELQSRLDSVVARLMARTTLEEENRRLRGLLGLQARLESGWTAAQVLRPGTQGSRSTFLLDVGGDDGIRARAPVITREGLAGRVTDVQDGVATGMDWTHPDFGASAMTEDGLYYGLVEAQQGAFREDDRLLMTTAFTADVQPGTVILTSGLGGVLPRGIPIGRVIELYEAQGRWQKSYWIEPYVRPGSLTQVLVGTVELRVETDLGPIFREDGYATAAEREYEDERLRDSLGSARDSIRVLRELLGFPVSPPGLPAPGGGGGTP